MCSKGPSAMWDRSAASISEHNTATAESVKARCNRGVSSLRRNTVETPTWMLPKALHSAAAGCERHRRSAACKSCRNLPPKTSVLQSSKNPAVQRFSCRLNSGSVSKDGFAVRVENGCVVDRRPAPDDGFQHGVQVAVGPQIVGDAAPHCVGIIGVDTSAAQVRSGIAGQVRQLRSQVRRSVVRGVDPLAQNLRDVDDTTRR